MNYTKAKIFNIVLKNLRVSVSIQSANQNDKNTIILNEFYDCAKEQVLKQITPILFTFVNYFMCFILCLLINTKSRKGA